ncbi:hypothetical protein Hanom_Chr16g01487911 [Helianthus anomalus]
MEEGEYVPAPENKAQPEPGSGELSETVIITPKVEKSKAHETIPEFNYNSCLHELHGNTTTAEHIPKNNKDNEGPKVVNASGIISGHNPNHLMASQK